MIRCVIIEDEPKAKDVLERYINKLENIELIGYFQDGLEALENLSSLNPDLIFLDINMPNLDGLELLKILKDPPQIIITTAYSEYALKSYDFEVLDYLLKPIEFDKFLRAVNRYLDKEKNNLFEKNDTKESTYTLIKSGSKTFKLNLDDILFLKKDGNYIEIVTVNEKKILLRSNMSDIFNLIPPDAFLRVHKSYIVPINKIEVIEVNKISIGKHKIPLGAIFRDELNIILKRKGL